MPTKKTAPKPAPKRAPSKGCKALAARIERVIAEGRVESARAWARAAGASEGMVTTLLVRARADDNADTGRYEIVQLARVANVSLEWLATGTGHPDAKSLQDGPPDPAYPNRARAAALARVADVDARAVATVRAMELPTGVADPPTWAWLEEILREQRALLDPLSRARGRG